MDNWFSVELPSKGLPYGVDPSLIQMTYTTGEVEEVIASINASNYEEKTVALLSKIVRGIDPKKLTLGDREALLVQNTLNTYSRFFPVNIKCNKCGAKLDDFDVDLKEVEFDDINSDGFEIRKEIKIGQYKAYVRLFTVGDEIAADKYEQDGGKFRYLYSISRMIDVVKGIDNQGKEIFMDSIEKLDLLKGLNPREYNEVKVYGAKYAHGTQMKYDFECPCCGMGATAHIPFLLSFLHPEPEIISRSMALEEQKLSKGTDGLLSSDVVHSGEGVSDSEEHERGDN